MRLSKRTLGCRGNGVAQWFDERPTPDGTRRALGGETPNSGSSTPAPGAAGLGGRCRLRAADERPHRGERIIRDLARPHQVPQRGVHGIAAVGQTGGLHGRNEIGPERRSPVSEVHADRLVGRVVGGFVGVRDQEADLVPVDETDAAIGCTERTSTDPHDLAARAQLIEVAAAIAVDPCGQHIALDHRSRNRRSLHLGNRFSYGIDAPTPRADPLPGRQEPSERVTLDRLDLTSKRRQRAAP